MATSANTTTTNATEIPPVIGKGKGTTNPVKNSKVPVKAEGQIEVLFRFFAADTTATLNGHPRPEKEQNAKSLSGLPFCIGTMEGDTFKPLHNSLMRLNHGQTSNGKIENGIFRPLNDEELKEWHKVLVDAKKKKVDPPKFQFHDSAIFSVKQGTVIAICIGVDAKNKYRNYPLWQVTADENKIIVNIFETFGKLGVTETATKASTLDEGSKDKPKLVDHYKAQLSGDTWMRSTPKLSTAEVDAIPDDHATTAMKDAIKRIYVDDFIFEKDNFAIDVERKKDDKDTAKVRLLWRATENNNCMENIKTLTVRKDVPSRIHPEAYAAAANAALNAGVERVEFSSSWRPMLGSMPHRLSLGLDLVFFKEGTTTVRLNRKGLLPDGKTKLHAKNENLAEDELKAYDTWKDMESKNLIANSEFDSAVGKLKNLENAKQALKKPSAEAASAADKAIEEAKAAVVIAKDNQTTAIDEQGKAKAAWHKQISENEPGTVGRYRRYIMQAPCVSQVLDPWYLVGLANHKAGELVPNEQAGENGLALQHNNHMHLSIKDAELTG